MCRCHLVLLLASLLTAQQVWGAGASRHQVAPSLLGLLDPIDALIGKSPPLCHHKLKPTVVLVSGEW